MWKQTFLCGLVILHSVRRWRNSGHLCSISIHSIWCRMWRFAMWRGSCFTQKVLFLPLTSGDCALKPELETVWATLSKHPCHLACWLWAGPYPASISLHFQSQALWGRIRERGEGARRSQGFMEDQSDPPDAWILSIGEPSGQMCRICQHLCSAAVREDLLGCLSPVMVIRHVSGSGVAESDAEMRTS